MSAFGPAPPLSLSADVLYEWSLEGSPLLLSDINYLSEVSRHLDNLVTWERMLHPSIIYSKGRDAAVLKKAALGDSNFGTSFLSRFPLGRVLPFFFALLWVQVTFGHATSSLPLLSRLAKNRSRSGGQ